MRNEWIGDIGDFSKFVLLNALVGGPGGQLQLGVVWYLNETGILPATYANLAAFSPAIFQSFTNIVNNDNRTVTSQAYKGNLPNGTLFYPVPLPNPLNQQARADWHRGALHEVRDAHIVFVDPDNGIPNVGQAASRKHVTLHELDLFYNQGKGKSLIIYQDMTQGIPQGQTANGKTRNLAQDLMQGLRPAAVFALRWRRMRGRVYLVVVHPNRAGVLLANVNAFVGNQEWFQQRPHFDSAHFENVLLN